jgi:hypothetical protein
MILVYFVGVMQESALIDVFALRSPRDSPVVLLGDAFLIRSLVGSYAIDFDVFIKFVVLHGGHVLRVS